MPPATAPTSGLWQADVSDTSYNQHRRQATHRPIRTLPVSTFQTVWRPPVGCSDLRRGHSAADTPCLSAASDWNSAHPPGRPPGDRVGDLGGEATILGERIADKDDVIADLRRRLGITDRRRGEAAKDRRLFDKQRDARRRERGPADCRLRGGRPPGRTRASSRWAIRKTCWVHGLTAPATRRCACRRSR